MDSTLTTKETDSKLKKAKMGLENTFGNVEKLPEEKRLEVITSKENILKDLESYFEKNKYKGIKFWGENKEYFGSCMEFFKSFELTPGIILEFNTKIIGVEEKEAFGLYLSAMMQTSHNQGYNNFKFEEVNADGFGDFLKAQPKKPIKITTKTLKGSYSLYKAENCSLITKMLNGRDSLRYSKNCILKTKTLKGNYNLVHADGCLAEIKNYQGTEFGYKMKNCIIKSENKKTLELIKKQVWNGVNNRFELKK